MTTAYAPQVPAPGARPAARVRRLAAMSVTGLYLHVAGRGACVGLGRPDDMFPDPADQAGVERARRVCGGCPVRAHCRTLARRLRVEHGVWGGVLHLPEPVEAADQPPERSTPDGD